MIYALDPKTERKIKASPGKEGLCPLCRRPLLPHCGEILAWHWKHQPHEACDPWSEGETLWHSRWKSLFPPDCVEVPFERRGEIHIADVHLPAGQTIELQHSSISPEVIREREKFYGPKLTWVFDVTEAFQGERFILWDQGSHWTFRWKHPRKTISAVKRRCFFDLGDLDLEKERGNWWKPDDIGHYLFEKRTIYFDETCRGSGRIFALNPFLDVFDIPSPPP
ncbi:MAG: hypothetical protein GX131_16375 [candidate division WS1 bacterium]|jgi:competence CoiA-like predicted nuclease|nr:hypothetical protein [candidate division WS1 bacterium]